MDITDTVDTDTVDIKVCALKQHASKVGEDSQQLERLETRIKKRTAEIGIFHDMKHTEAFKNVRLRQDLVTYSLQI